MKKVTLGFLLLILTRSVFAIDANTVIINQVDPTGSFQIGRIIAPPSSDGYLKYSSSTNIPEWSLMTASAFGAAPTVHTHTAAQISDSSTIGKQLLTAANQAAVQSIVGISATQVNSDWSSVSGVSQILNKPAKYSGSTNGSGVYAVTYPAAYGSKPQVLFAVEGGTNKDTSVLTSTTSTGFSITVERRTDIAGLLPTYAVVSGITVNATVTP